MEPAWTTYRGCYTMYTGYWVTRYRHYHLLFYYIMHCMTVYLCFLQPSLDLLWDFCCNKTKFHCFCWIPSGDKQYWVRGNVILHFLSLHNDVGQSYQLLVFSGWMTTVGIPRWAWGAVSVVLILLRTSSGARLCSIWHLACVVRLCSPWEHSPISD
jgi:hypothetical protein